MFNTFKSVAIDILGYILFLVFSFIFLLIAALLPEEFILPLAGLGVILSGYLSNVITNKLR